MIAAVRMTMLLMGAGLGLGGCVTLLPKAAPAQLYRFGFDPGVPATGSSAPAPLGFATGRPRPALGAVTLSLATAGDGILTVRGDAVAYVAGARWVSPAVDLLREAADLALAEAPALPLDGVHSNVLVLEGRTFETRYTASEAPPVVRVSIRAALAGRDGRRLGETTFTVEAPAAENRVGAIVAAYDVAVSDVLRRAVGWSVIAPPSRP